MSFYNFMTTILFMCLILCGIILFTDNKDSSELINNIDISYCEIYEHCNKINFDPITKNYNFCGLTISEDKLKEDCLT